MSQVSADALVFGGWRWLGKTFLLTQLDSVGGGAVRVVVSGPRSHTHTHTHTQCSENIGFVKFEAEPSWS